MPSEVHVYDAKGEKLRGWKVGFAAQAINIGPNGNVFVAGSGKLAEYTPTGSLLHELDLPHLEAILKNQDELNKRAEEQLQSERESYKEMIAQLRKEVETLEKKEADKLSNQEKAQLRAYKMNLKAYEQQAKALEKRTVKDAVKEVTARLRIVNAVAVTDQDIFIAGGEAKGYGYAVWRMNREFKDSKQVLSGLGGCCGQMDIQAQGNKLFVAENTRHRVGVYDRDGKRLTSFGKKGRDGDPECFGSCCNPMNCRIAADGSIFTAESEGHIKRFAADGKLIGPVGSAKLTGGCKNVAVAVSADGATVYFCDQPGSRIIVLTKKSTVVQREE